jgi:hypothetical protein
MAEYLIGAVLTRSERKTVADLLKRVQRRNPVAVRLLKRQRATGGRCVRLLGDAKQGPHSLVSEAHGPCEYA